MRRPTLALLLALAAAGAQAGCSRELSVGVSDLGCSAYLEDGHWRGIAPDLIAELGRRSGCQLTLRPRPRARALLEFEQGQMDLITASRRTPDCDLLGHYLPYGYGELDLIVAGDSVPRSLDGLRQRPELKLGVVRGLRLGPVLDGIVDGMFASRQAEYSPDFDNLAAKLKAGRLQAAIFPSVIHARMRREGQLPADAVVVDLAEAPTELIGMYLTRKNTTAADVQLLQHHLEAMRREGEVQAIYARHVGEAEARRLFRNAAR